VGYAVVGYFDEKSDKIIKSLWQGMADANVCDYLINSANNPHIKFAMFDEIDQTFTEKNLNTLAKRTRKQYVHFKTYSFYPNNEPFICIDIAVSMPILQLQKEIQTEFNINATKGKRGFFEQGIWKPDCQLTLAFDRSKLYDAVDYLSKTQLPFDGMIERIGLIEFHPAKQLYSYEFS